MCSFKMAVKPATYIRKYCHDIGQALDAEPTWQNSAELGADFKEDETLKTLQDVNDAYHYSKEDDNKTPSGLCFTNGESCQPP